MIIVADPARTTADLLCRRLRSDGLEARAVANLPALMEAVSGKRIEAIVIDPSIGFPERPVSLLRKKLPGVPILAFGSSDQDVATTLAEGAGAFMLKGRVTPTQLVSRLKELIKGVSVGHREGEATGATEGSYYLQVDARAGDAGRLAVDTGMEAGMRCPDCHGAMSLYMQRDFTRWGKWLFGTFGCLVCAKRSQKREPAVQVQIPMQERVLAMDMEPAAPHEELEIEIEPTRFGAKSPGFAGVTQASGWGHR
jgi:hypothetical protein